MRSVLTAAALTLALFAVVSAAGPGYHVVKEIQIGGEGGWDYIIADAAAHRLYVSHATKIVVTDTESGAVVGEIPDLAGVHGFAIAADLGRGFTSNGRSNSSTIVDLKTLKPLGTVAVGANPDSIRYLADRKEVWTINHTAGSITAFDPMTGKVIATIEVGGTLEEAIEDPGAHRVYVNVEDKGALAVVDTLTHALVATWPMAGCEGPTGLAFDAKNHLLLSACDGRMAVTDSASGRAVTSFPIADGVDGNGFDPSTGLAFASSGTGDADRRPRGRAGSFHGGGDREDAIVGPHDVARSVDAPRLRAGGDGDTRRERPQPNHAGNDEGARPGDRAMMPPVESVGYGAALLTTVAFVPQVWKTWRTRSAGDLSTAMLVIFTAGVSLWLVYGLLLGSAPIIAANVATLALSALLVALRLRFGRP